MREQPLARKVFLPGIVPSTIVSPGNFLGPNTVLTSGTILIGRAEMKSIMYPAAGLLAITLCLGVVNASGPIGVYALIDKVTFEPGSDKPERIRILGVFIAAEQRPDNSTVYSAPQRGYLYFRLPGNNAELARREWSDLKSVAGTRLVVGLGSSWSEKVHITSPDEEPKSPAEYPMGNGLVKINSNQPRARALLDYKGR
jgi:hypothetical protein